MIDYQTFHQIRQLHDQEHLSGAQIAQALQLDERTVAKWIVRQTYQPRASVKRTSKLDPHKGTIVRLLAAHPYTAQQLLQRLRDSGYVKQNFLAGLELASLEALNAAARLWLDQVANVRLHGETHQVPQQVFAQEQPHLHVLTARTYDLATLHHVTVSGRCRVTLETNHYSVPPALAGKALVLKAYPDRLCLYQADQLITEHARSYERHRDFEKPEHVAELLAQRRQARTQQLLSRFLALSPRAREYYQQLEEKRGNPRHHVQKIVALSEIYGVEKVQRALEDAWAYQAFSCEYIANLLEQQARPWVEPGALHLTRQQDLLDLDLPAPDLSLYTRPEGGAA